MQPVAIEQEQNWSYLFEECERANTPDGKLLLGGKGAALAEMTGFDLPVPPGFVITTECCKKYHLNEKIFPDGMWRQARAKLDVIEQKLGKKFGDTENPLLVSVRSGSPVSMPGMMDTVLNLGLNDKTVEGLARADRRRTLRVGRLPALYLDVQRDCAGCRARKIRARFGTL